MKVKGFQVAPAELEGCLLDHPDVSNACVVGVPDDYSVYTRIFEFHCNDTDMANLF